MRNLKRVIRSWIIGWLADQIIADIDAKGLTDDDKAEILAKVNAALSV